MAGYKTDIEIARAVVKKPIYEIGDRLGIPAARLSPYGHDKGEDRREFTTARRQASQTASLFSSPPSIRRLPARPDDHDRELGDRLNRIGKKAVICVREPSLEPCFRVKGGAAGGGYAQVVPMEISTSISPAVSTPITARPITCFRR